MRSTKKMNCNKMMMTVRMPLDLPARMTLSIISMTIVLRRRTTSRRETGNTRRFTKLTTREAQHDAMDMEAAIAMCYLKRRSRAKGPGQLPQQAEEIGLIGIVDAVADTDDDVDHSPLVEAEPEVDAVLRGMRYAMMQLDKPHHEVENQLRPSYKNEAEDRGEGELGHYEPLDQDFDGNSPFNPVTIGGRGHGYYDR